MFKEISQQIVLGIMADFYDRGLGIREIWQDLNQGTRDIYLDEWTKQTEEKLNEMIEPVISEAKRKSLSGLNGFTRVIAKGTMDPMAHNRIALILEEINRQLKNLDQPKEN